MTAAHALPDGSAGEDGLTKERVKHAMLLATHFCANAHPAGSMMSAGLLVPAAKKAKDDREQNCDLPVGEGAVTTL
ncbi:hypothetical protein [Lysobacter sp. A03]|uniref:hypothetical protein n=1 Tax=Lysobacter sp. A03 TaxID=1199154 RepID=UPI0005B6D7F3|nr:hypothetical protein [Lysobacter sp. A03]KIQ97344.1 hypothetical protein TI01_1061 [Lysobacter sp. A03]